MVIYYIAYTLYLILHSNHDNSLPLYSAVMLWFVIPITALLLLITARQTLRARRQ